jgi:aminoglycoside phosphotransferase (APT) family kinase protein
MNSSQLDIEAPGALRNYLLERGLLAAEESVQISILSGGVSSRTVLVRREDGESWVVKQALPALRVATEWRSNPARSRREAAGARALAKLLPPGSVPAIVFEDPAHHLFVMTAAPPGARNWKTLLLAGQVEPAHFSAAGALLADLHSSCADLAAEFADTSFFETLRLEPYYEFTASQAPAAAPFLEGLCEATRRSRFALTHGDFSPKNILVDGERLILLDHEVIHFGDPAFDLGFFLTHCLSKAHHLPTHREELARAASYFVAQYRARARTESWGSDFWPRAAAHTVACLLARVLGRSPLEYLSVEERARQQRACLRLQAALPPSLESLIGQFLEELAK